MQTQLEHRAFLLLLTVVSVAFFWLLLPFYGAVFWAVILAIVFQPLQRNFEYRFGSRSNLAAFLSVMVCIVIAIIPMTLIVGALIREGTELVGAGAERRHRPVEHPRQPPGRAAALGAAVVRPARHRQPRAACAGGWSSCSGRRAR